MKDISFEVGISRCEPPNIRVVEITVVVPEPEDRELCITHEFASYDTDPEHFEDFIGHIKFKLREIFEKAETTKDLIASFEERFVKNYFQNYYIVDIK